MTNLLKEEDSAKTWNFSKEVVDGYTRQNEVVVKIEKKSLKIEQKCPVNTCLNVVDKFLRLHTFYYI